MYVDYRIINEKEIEAINDKAEIIKITGLNTGDIKKALLLSNKIEGLYDKIKNESEIMKNANDEIAETKEKRNKTIVQTIIYSACLALFILSGSIALSILGGLLVTTGLTLTTLKIKKIKKIASSNLKIAEDWSINLEKSVELKKELRELMTKIKVEKRRSEKREELVKAYKEGLKNETDFSLDYDDVKTLKLR